MQKYNQNKTKRPENEEKTHTHTHAHTHARVFVQEASEQENALSYKKLAQTDERFLRYQTLKI